MVKKRIVVVGGGTGTHTVLSGLRQYSDELSLTAIVSMADSGGSTGRLRDEFGQLPAGDVRNALTALAAEAGSAAVMRQLFLYRFNRGEGLAGHNFGNLFLTALTDILGSEVAAIEAAARILRVEGEVIPVTIDDAHLKAVYADGVVVHGEHDIDEWQEPARRAVRITALTLEPAAALYEKAQHALLNADLIILGPGDLYTSVLANCVVTGFRETLQSAPATVVYVSNLMSKAGQTIGLQAAEHLAEVTRYTGRHPDYLLCNNAPLPRALVEKYAREGDHPVENNYLGDTKTKVIALPLIAEEEIKTVAGDVLRRSLIRHDANKLAVAIRSLL